MQNWFEDHNYKIFNTKINKLINFYWIRENNEIIYIIIFFYYKLT